MNFEPYQVGNLSPQTGRYGRLSCTGQNKYARSGYTVRTSMYEATVYSIPAIERDLKEKRRYHPTPDDTHNRDIHKLKNTHT